MLCPYCSAPLLDGAKFCGACGKPVPAPLPVDVQPPVDPQPPVDAQPPADPQPPVDAQPPADPQPPVDAQPPVDPPSRRRRCSRPLVKRAGGRG